MSCPKRLVGVAARPLSLEPPVGDQSAPKIQSIQALVFLLLVPNIFADNSLAPTGRRNEIPPCPEVLPEKIALTPQYTRARSIALFPFCVTHHLRNRILRRYRDHDMHMILHQVPFLDPASLLFRQSAKHLSKIPPQLTIQRLAPAFRNECNVIFSLPLRVI